MNRRTFFASVVSVLGALKFWTPAAAPQLALHPDAFKMAMEPLMILTNARAGSAVFITSGGQGYILNGCIGEPITRRLSP